MSYMMADFSCLDLVTKLYPPKSNDDLRSLVGHIVSSELDIHHKQALIYYILKDCRAAGEAASQFARRCFLPEKYRLFIEGLWNLDRLEFKVCSTFAPCRSDFHLFKPVRI